MLHIFKYKLKDKHTDKKDLQAINKLKNIFEGDIKN